MQVRVKSLNILFVFTDQQAYFRKWPAGFSLPGMERLQTEGVNFHRHYCPATQCTSSRSVLMTGLQTALTGMYENLDLPWVKDLSTDIPTIGHMLRKAGYYTAYKGKWHLTRSFDQAEPTRLLTPEMETYGFSDYNSPGDIVGHQLGGYEFDGLIAQSAVTWLRKHGRPLNDDGQPWALTVSLVNPHDVMYFNTDAPGENLQDNGCLMSKAVRAPDHEFYRKEWDLEIPASLYQSITEPGRPPAHLDYVKAWDYYLGQIRPDADRWQRLNNFYLNSIRAVDLQILSLLKELDDLKLSDHTIVVFTSDHGEMGGAHGGMRGKGPTPYEECIHLPLLMVHPEVSGGQDCEALTSHMDVAPTLLAMAGATDSQISDFAGRDLPGKDLTKLLTNPASATANQLRDGALFTYSGLSMIDSDPLANAARLMADGMDFSEALRSAGKPNLRKRGSVRTIVDGRYKFNRYFSPLEHNTPRSLEDLYRYNDLELFDLQEDPAELCNLAMSEGVTNDLVATMNTKLNALIEAEIGLDDGRELPQLEGVSWELRTSGNAVILD
ncbi:MAG: sulfatase [Cyanobium sp. CACIAM 14]|nr:MAG: sulfatase [Cyanobium sp. CACIAM 14]